MTPTDLERLIRRDPAGRGLLSSDRSDELCRGHLHGAAQSLASASRVGIATGFYVADADPPAAETDGLSGSILLADVLQRLGIDVILITDQLCESSLRAGVAASHCRDLKVLASPCGGEASRNWIEELNGVMQTSHLIAIERAGPSYTPELLRTRPWVSEEVIANHLACVEPSTHGRCHNMRGIDIHETTAELHRLFESPCSDGITTIGVCDGGNEIGAGNIPWPQLSEVIAGTYGPQIACRTPTDWTVLAGVSDWGAFALASALCTLRGTWAPIADWTGERIESLLDGAVRNGPTLDGVTRRLEPTVDGLPFMTYIQPWLFIRRKLGLDVRS